MLDYWGANERERERERERAMSICEMVETVKQYLHISRSHVRFHISQYEMQCSGVAVMYAQKVGGPSAFSIYVHSPICQTYLV